MNDWQIVIIEELKSLNRKMERMEDKLSDKQSALSSKIDILERDLHEELVPIKKHVTQVRFASVLLPSLITLAGVISRMMP